MIEITKEQRKHIEIARDFFHVSVLDVLCQLNIDYQELDLTEVGERIVLDGCIDCIDQEQK